MTSAEYSSIMALQISAIRVQVVL